MGHTASKVKGSISFGRGNTFGNLPVGSDGNILVADSSGPSGVNWSSSLLTVGAGVGISGFWMYGTGFDGNVTLVGNTTLAAGDSVKNYNNLDLAGFDLTFDSTDFYMVVYVKDTISGGGNLLARFRGSGTFNAGGLGGLTPAGDGGAGAAAIYVFARNITAAIEVSAAGQGGVAGAGPSIFLLPGANSEYASSVVFKAKTYPSPIAFPGTQGGFHFGPGIGFGGGGGSPTVSAADRQEIERTATDWIRMVVMNGFSDYVAAAPSPDERWSRSNGGGGGAAGFGPNPGPAMIVVAGGGGGAGGAGIGGDGGAGGGAAAVLVTLGPAETSITGAGGGGGGGGGVAILVTDTVTAATSVSTVGGIGGAGSAGTGVPADPGGGGGGGGGGGYSLAIVRSGVAFVTATAVGGAAGLGGGGGTPGAMGGTGFPGISAVLVSA